MRIKIKGTEKTETLYYNDGSGDATQDMVLYWDDTTPIGNDEDGEYFLLTEAQFIFWKTFFEDLEELNKEIDKMGIDPDVVHCAIMDQWNSDQDLSVYIESAKKALESLKEVIK